MNKSGRHFVQLNANPSNVNDSDDFDSEKSISLYELNENANDTNTFDEKSYIKSILESQIRDLENNNSELSDYERAVLNKYMKDIDMNNDLCDSYLHQKFPVQLQLKDSLTTFPTKDEQTIARKSPATLVAPDTNLLQSADKPTICNETQVVNNKRNNVSNNRNARSVLRRQFSIWVGVTSCLWGLLLYLDKTYF